MRQSRFTVEEIIRIIAESELPATSIAGTARKYGIKEATLYRWRAKYKGLGKSEAKRLKVGYQTLIHRVLAEHVGARVA